MDSIINKTRNWSESWVMKIILSWVCACFVTLFIWGSSLCTWWFIWFIGSPVLYAIVRLMKKCKCKTIKYVS
jgi:membrane protein YdbS with pleckstrin-like domain